MGNGTSSIVPGKRVRIIGPDVNGDKDMIGEELEVVRQEIVVSSEYGKRYFFPSSLAPLDDEQVNESLNELS